MVTSRKQRDTKTIRSCQQPRLQPQAVSKAVPPPKKLVGSFPHGCCNRSSQTWWLKTTHICSLTVPEVINPKSLSLTPNQDVSWATFPLQAQLGAREAVLSLFQLLEPSSKLYGLSCHLQSQHGHTLLQIFLHPLLLSFQPLSPSSKEPSDYFCILLSHLQNSFCHIK